MLATASGLLVKLFIAPELLFSRATVSAYWLPAWDKGDQEQELVSGTYSLWQLLGLQDITLCNEWSFLESEQTSSIVLQAARQMVS